MPFDPDAYLAKKKAFDPDAYLANKQTDVLNVPKSNPTIPTSLAVPSSTATRSPFNTYTAPDRTVEGAIAPFKQPGKTLSNAAEDIAFGRPAAGIAGGAEAGLQAGLALTGFPSLIGAMENNPITSAKTPLFPSVADVANAPFDAVQNLYNASAGGLIDKAQAAAGVDPYTKSKVNELFGTAVPLAILPSLFKGVNEAGNLVEDIRQKRAAESVNQAKQQIREVAPPSAARSKAAQAKGYDERINTASQYLADQYRESPLSKKNAKGTLEQGSDLIHDAKDKLWERASVIGKPYENVLTDVSPAVDKAIEDMPENVKTLHPEDVQKASEYLDRYRKPIKLSVVEKEIADINAQEKAYYRANDVEKAQMLRDDPALKLKIDFADHLRQHFFDEVEKQGDPNIQRVRKDFGALSEVGKNYDENMEKNRKLDEKGNPFSLGFGSPLRRGFWVGALTKLLGFSPITAAGAEAVATGHEMYKTHQARPSVKIESALKKLGKSDLRSPDYSKPDAINIPPPQTGIQAVPPKPPSGTPPFEDATFEEVQPQTENLLPPAKQVLTDQPASPVPPSPVQTPPETGEPEQPEQPEKPKVEPSSNLDPEQAYKKMAEDAGIKYDGTKNTDRLGDVANFTIRSMKETPSFSLKVKDITPENIKAKIEEVKKRFAPDQPSPPQNEGKEMAQPAKSETQPKANEPEPQAKSLSRSELIGVLRKKYPDAKKPGGSWRELLDKSTEELEKLYNKSISSLPKKDRLGILA
jgi:hypothetical protein